MPDRPTPLGRNPYIAAPTQEDEGWVMVVAALRRVCCEHDSLGGTRARGRCPCADNLTLRRGAYVCTNVLARLAGGDNPEPKEKANDGSGVDQG